VLFRSCIDRFYYQTFELREELAEEVMDDSSDVKYTPFFGEMMMGSDALGRPLFWRCMLGGAISLGIGICAAFISVFIGVLWGATSGLAGGRTDAVMMRTVDIIYGLPYILLVILVKIAMECSACVTGKSNQRAYCPVALWIDTGEGESGGVGADSSRPTCA